MKNMVFGRLTVIKHMPGHKGRNQYFLCQCDCGKKKIIRKEHLLRGRARSCGCLQRELTRDRMLEHGLSNTRAYKIWRAMKRRCLNKNVRNFKNYGGRGITICERWKDSVLNFYNDMGERPKGMSLERINNDGNYEPSNCKWATREEQMNNTRTNVFITYNNERKTLAQWCKKLGIRRETVESRLHLGWNAKDALSIPVKVSTNL